MSTSGWHDRSLGRSGFATLFGESPTKGRSSFSLTGSIRGTSVTTGGYFAFPPVSDGGTGTPAAVITEEPSQASKSSFGDALPGIGSLKDEMTEEAITQEEEAEENRRKEERRKRREKESELASQGEFEWVRSGGVLRDAEGRRDKVRTEAIKAEIRLQEREKNLAKRWDAYESKWRTLLASNDAVSFKDIPWPLPLPPTTVKELTFEDVSRFLLESLEARTNTVTRRERIRSSMLRWHPDKISSVLSRVIEEDRIAVREGLGMVMMALKRMKEN
ncbi:hypothetical protein HWV62_14500 [Athelia sp. TMB]|nr:hypothetical protein HWV62_14500 [Athelia sp. TMB]